MNAQGKIARVAKKAPLALDIYTKKADLEAAVNSMGERGKSFQQEVHKCACSTLYHLGKHGNINVLVHFLDKVPDMVRKNALQQWFEKFANVTFGIRDGIDTKATWYVDNAKKPRLGDAMVNPFWKFKAKEGEEYKALKVDDYMRQQYIKLGKDLKAVKPTDDKDPRVVLFQSFKACLGGNVPSLN